METIYKILDTRMTTPEIYGPFHIGSIIIVLALTAFICIKFKDCDYTTFRRIIGIFWGAIVLAELYKEFIFTFSLVDGKLEGTYPWYIFPFQFCSSVFYVLPFIFLFKQNKMSEACVAFTGLYVFAAGFLVYCYPDTVYTPLVGINIQTMLHHGTQIVLGVFILVRYRRKLTWSFYLNAISVFLVFATVAFVLNETFVKIIPEGEVFNMFFISRYFPCTLPVLSEIHAEASYPIFLLVYLIGFSLAGFIVFGLARLANLPYYKKANTTVPNNVHF